IVSDIATDPLWDLPEHRAAALNHGLRASWSNPVLSSQGKVLGTFCMYSREARIPASQDIELIELATHLARVAIEREHAEEALRRSESFLAEGQRISLTGSWGWNLHTGKIIWSDEQCRMLGFDVPTEPSLELFFDRVHPEDRGRIRQTLDQASRAGSQYEIQYRVVLPNGVIRYFKSVGRPVKKKAARLANTSESQSTLPKASGQKTPYELPNKSHADRWRLWFRASTFSRPPRRQKNSFKKCLAQLGGC